MKTVTTTALFFAAFASALVATTSVSAQAPGGRGGDGPGRGGMLMLLNQKSVQDELKLSAEQTTKVEAATKKQRENAAGLRNADQQERRQKMEELVKDAEKQVAEILDAGQLKRLKQITWQQQGPQAIESHEVAAALHLTDEQKTKAKSILEESRKEMRALYGDGANQGEARTKAEAIRKATGEKLAALLTEEQTAKWKELLGDPFKGEIQRPGGRNRRQQ